MTDTLRGMSPEAHSGAAAPQDVAIGPLEGGARHGCGRVLVVDPVTQRSEPKYAVGVGESSSAGHDGDVPRAVEVIGLGEATAEASGEQRGHGRLATAGDTHHDDDAGSRVARSHAHPSSPMLLVPRPSGSPTWPSAPGRSR